MSYPGSKGGSGVFRIPLDTPLRRLQACIAISGVEGLSGRTRRSERSGALAVVESPETLSGEAGRGFGAAPWLGRVLVACEYSGRVRDAFAALGWDAWSCDLLPSEKPGKHRQCDVREILDEGWDIMVAHPPCTHLAVSGARWFSAKQREQAEALDFVRLLLAAPIPRIALENPVSIISSKIRKPDQVIQPWQHGHGETKATCLWLKNLPCLTPSNIVEGREQRIWKLPPSADRWKERSRTFSGVAQAMANQWTLATRPNNRLTYSPDVSEA